MLQNKIDSHAPSREILYTGVVFGSIGVSVEVTGRHAECFRCSLAAMPSPIPDSQSRRLGIKGGQLENYLRKLDNLDRPVSLRNSISDRRRQGRFGKGINFSDSTSVNQARLLCSICPVGAGNVWPRGIPARLSFFPPDPRLRKVFEQSPRALCQGSGALLRPHCNRWTTRPGYPIECSSIAPARSL